MMTRRTFLMRTAAAGALAFSGGVFFSRCGGTGRMDFAEPHRGKEIPGLDPLSRDVLYQASLAPSGHNSQPWIVSLAAADEWVLRADPSRRLPAVDPDNREQLLSMGAFVENLVLAAAGHAIQARVEITARSPFDEEIARVRLSKIGRPSHEEAAARIRTRRTIKKGLLPHPVKSADIRDLGEDLPDRLFFFPGDSSHGRCIAEGTVESFRTQSTRDEAQREFARWVRLDRAAAGRHRDGLTVEGMEIDGFAGWYLRKFAAPEDFLKPAYRNKGVDGIAELVKEGAGWLVITGDPGPGGLIDTGRRFERMALRCRDRGIGIHPMTQLLEEESGRALIAANHDSGMIPQFVLRIGYVENYPKPVSLRRPVDWFVTV